MAADGAIQFVCRNDRQVQIRGARVEPAEVEARLAEHPGVMACAVVAVEHGATSSLHAYVVSRRSLPLDVRGLRQFLARRVPAAMVPARFLAIDVLPMTTSGKIDRQALPRCPAVRLRRASSSRRPLATTEKLIAEVFGAVLGMPGVRAESDFFDLGGDSLSAVEVVTRLGDELDCDVEVRDVLEHPTPSDLSRRLEPRKGRRRAPGATERSRDLDGHTCAGRRGCSSGGSRPTARPVRSSTTAAWRLRCSAHSSTTRWSPQPNRSARRHPALRTAIVHDEDGWRQSARDEVAAVTVCSTVAEHDVAEHVRRAVALPFELASPPLVRISLLRCSDSHHVVTFIAHRVIADAWSMQILLRDLSRQYFHLVDGCPPPAPLATDLSRTAPGSRRRVHGRATSPPAAPERAWQPTWQGWPSVISTIASGYSTVSVDRTIPLPTARLLREFAERVGVETSDIYLAALHLLVGRETRTPDVTVGRSDSGRAGWPELEGVVGCFERELPIRLRWSGGDCVEDLLGEAGRRSAAARTSLDPPTDHCASVTFEHASSAPLRPGTVTLAPLDLGEHLSATDLHLSAVEGSARAQATLRFRRARFSDARADGLADEYVRIVERLARCGHGVRLEDIAS